ncbi:MAG: HU family DNA-binding protein [Bdellovibrionota bacterium]
MTTLKKQRTPILTASTASLMNEVASKFQDIPKKITREVLSSFLSTIETHITDGKKVRIDKLGVISIRDTVARKGRNPKTGEEILIPAKKKIFFRSAKALKEIIGIKTKKSATTTKPIATKKK